MSVISMKQLLEAGVHFGHQTRKWNPKMKKYIFTARNNIHIINLEATSECVDKAYTYVRDIAASGKNVLFVGTKKQASESIKEEAERCGMFYVNTRWLGGTLTNFKTIRNRIERLNKLNQMEKVGEFDLLPKKEVALLKQERDKLEKNLGGIKDMHDLPGLIFVVDPTNEKICVHEAKILNIPVVSLVDTNCDPSFVDFVIPGNDDAIRSVKLIAAAIADAVIEAREGVSMKKDNADEEGEEEMDLETLLTQAKPTAELAEAGEVRLVSKKFKKKTPFKKDVKSENKSEETAGDKNTENTEEVVKAEKSEKVKSVKSNETVEKSVNETEKPKTKTVKAAKVEGEEKPKKSTKTAKTTTEKADK